MPAGYVTNYGNAENDGLSWATPKRSIQNAVDAGLNPIYFSGYFNENLNAAIGSKTIYGVGHAVIDNIMLPTSNWCNISKNAVIKNGAFNLNSGNGNGTNYENLQLIDVAISYTVRPSFTKCIIKPKGTFLDVAPYASAFMEQTTIVGNGIDAVYSRGSSSTNYAGNKRFKACIFSNFTGAGGIEALGVNVFNKSDWAICYTLFHNCKFKFKGGALGNDETVFSLPTGLNEAEKLDNLRQRCVNVYGGVKSDYFIGCRYQTDGSLFIDPNKLNYYLAPDCLASKMSYKGGYVGCFPEGSLSDFPSNFVSYSNMDSLGNIINQTQDAFAETNIIDLGKLRHINSLVALGERAARNGNAINLDADLSAAVYPGTALIEGKTYIVRAEAISQTASGKTRDVGETFIAKASAGLAFTSGTGYVQEVLLNKPRSIEIKASKTDPTLATAAWLKMDLYAEPRVNYDANGVLQYGNLDAGYNAATSERMFIRYWKARITVKANNLPA